jgi:hypothetical protein
MCACRRRGEERSFVLARSDSLSIIAVALSRSLSLDRGLYRAVRWWTV